MTGRLDVMQEHMVAISTLMRSQIEVSAEKRAANAVVAAERGFDEEALWREWVNETIFASTENDDRFEIAVANPAGAYSAWFLERIEDPYRVPSYIVTKACMRYTPEMVMRLAMVTWRQEIAWAQRSRRLSDDRASVLASLFLSAVKTDAGRFFLAMCDAFVARSGDYAYMNSPVHNLDASAIRYSRDIPDFLPLFRTVGEAEFSDTINNATLDQLAAMAAKRRAAEEKEIETNTRLRVVTTLKNARLGRMTGAIKAAVDMGFDANHLFAAEHGFLKLVSAGKITVSPDSGLPYGEFLEFMLGGFKAVDDDDYVAESLKAVQEILRTPGRFFMSLPASYAELGSNDLQTLGEWIAPYAKGLLPPPRDLQMDYGFFLVKTNFRAPKRQESKEDDVL